MTNKEMILIRINTLELMIFANEAEIDATFNAMKKFSGLTELNGRLLVLQDVNKSLKTKLKNLESVIDA